MGKRISANYDYALKFYYAQLLQAKYESNAFCINIYIYTYVFFLCTYRVNYFKCLLVL